MWLLLPLCCRFFVLEIFVLNSWSVENFFTQLMICWDCCTQLMIYGDFCTQLMIYWDCCTQLMICLGCCTQTMIYGDFWTRLMIYRDFCIKTMIYWDSSTQLMIYWDCCTYSFYTQLKLFCTHVRYSSTYKRTFFSNYFTDQFKSNLNWNNFMPLCITVLYTTYLQHDKSYHFSLYFQVSADLFKCVVHSRLT